jgi:hypothetical protein
MKRLAVYDELRKMHAIFKAIPDREDDFEQNALDGVEAVLYLAEGVFAKHEDDDEISQQVEFRRNRYSVERKRRCKRNTKRK